MRTQRTESELRTMLARNASRIAAARASQVDATTTLALMRESEPEQLHGAWSDLARQALDSGVASAVLFHGRTVWSAAFSPDGRRIVTMSDDDVVRVWNADVSGEPLLLLKRFEQPPIWAEFSPDGTRIVGCSLDGTARVLDADGVPTSIVLRGHEAPVASAGASPDGTRILAGSWDGTAQIWNADGSRAPIILRGHQAESNLRCSVQAARMSSMPRPTRRIESGVSPPNRRSAGLPRASPLTTQGLYAARARCGAIGRARWSRWRPGR